MTEMPLYEQHAYTALIQGGKDTATAFFAELKASHFSTAEGQLLYGVAQNVWLKNKCDYVPLDKLYQALDADGGSMAAKNCIQYLDNWTSVNTPARCDNMPDYIATIKEAAIKRQYLAELDAAQRAEKEKDRAASLEHLRNAMFINTETGEQYMHRAADAADDFLKALQENRHGILSGFTKLDRINDGFHPAELIVIGACTSVGKTSLAVTMALNMAMAGKRVAFFSLEMSCLEITKKCIQIIGELTRGQIDICADLTACIDTDAIMEKAQDAAITFSNLPLLIYDKAGITVEDISTIAMTEQAIHTALMPFLWTICKSLKQQARQRTGPWRWAKYRVA